jgi:hypothetical protein
MPQMLNALTTSKVSANIMPLSSKNPLRYNNHTATHSPSLKYNGITQSEGMTAGVSFKIDDSYIKQRESTTG